MKRMNRSDRKAKRREDAETRQRRYDNLTSAQKRQQAESRTGNSTKELKRLEGE